MRFAILGSHPDGLELAAALVETGRHEIVAYSSSAMSSEDLRRLGTGARPVGDLEEVLADPQVEAVIVAGTPENRPAQLRRALQSERHVLCVHPPDRTPDAAYEAAMIQNDVRKALLPLMPRALHPGVARLTEWLNEGALVSGRPALIELEIGSREEALLGMADDEKPAFPGWDVLRALGGEIAEVSGFASAEETSVEDPALVAGRFEQGGLFRASWLPRQERDSCRIGVTSTKGRFELLFPLGWRGPAYLGRHDPEGKLHEEAWTTWDPWPVLISAFEAAVRGEPHRPVWQETIRALELDDAARRSITRRRSSLMEYPEATEEAGFKGTMTLVGCGLLWGLLVLLVIANWFPALFWVAVPLLLSFLALQILRWAVPKKETASDHTNPTR